MTGPAALWHAVDAPFADPDEWLAGLHHGICMACGGEASRGQLRWWHRDHRICPKRIERRPGFSPDEPEDQLTLAGRRTPCPR